VIVGKQTQLQTWEHFIINFEIYLIFFGKLTTLLVFYVTFLVWLQKNYCQLLKIMS